MLEKETPRIFDNPNELFVPPEGRVAYVVPGVVIGLSNDRRMKISSSTLGQYDGPESREVD